MRVEERRRCPICGATGGPIYEQVSDRLLGVPGTWDVKRCSAAGCRVLWLDPAPAVEQLPLAYADYPTHDAGDETQRAGSPLRSFHAEARRAYLADQLGYDFAGSGLRRRLLSLGLRAWPGRRAATDAQVMHLAALPGGRVLDVGCGNGRAVALLGSLGWEAEGIDSDAEAVAAGRSAGLSLHAGTLETVALEQTFDAITMRHVIEHVHDPASLLRQCHRLLRPHGQLVIVTPNAESWLHRIYGRDWLALDPPRHLEVFTLSALRSLVGAAGYTVEQAGTSFHSAVMVAVGSRALRRHGRHDLRRRTPPSDRARAELIEHIEWLASKFVHDLGEEIVITARRRENESTAS